MSLSKALNSQLQSDRIPPNDELTRLASYVNWPSAAEVWPSTLSRHGFVYEGRGDATRCVACGVVVDSWQRGARPADVHRTKSPRCPFVIADSNSGGRDVDDVGTTLQQVRLNEPQASFHTDGETPTDSSTLPSTSPGPPAQRPDTAAPVDRTRPDFRRLQSSESERLSTFHDWPASSGRIVDARNLAAAGLFYTGHADRVQCAVCRGCLRSWRPGDRPAEQHRRHFPDCPLVRHAALTGNVPSDNSTTVRSLFVPYTECGGK